MLYATTFYLKNGAYAVFCIANKGENVLNFTKAAQNDSATCQVLPLQVSLYFGLEGSFRSEDVGPNALDRLSVEERVARAERLAFPL